jgi:3-oxoacyl-[acyl-carrier protein] reductase
MNLGISGRKALVCASSKGLGLAVAKRLAAEGAELLICARNLSDLELAAAEIEQASPRGVKPKLIARDLSLASSVQDLLAEVQKTFGGIDILINNVGGPAPSSAELTSLEAWRQGFDQIFLSAISLTQALIPQMKKNKWGRVVTITSLSVVEPIDHLVVSTAMRSAVTTFMKTLSKEVAPYGITCNTVLPGVIHTGRIENLRKAKAQRDGTSLDIEMEKTAQTIPMKRLGHPRELADLVGFLVSENASYITGVNIPVDGGLRSSW